MRALEARVRRLEFEERRAQKLSNLAEKRHRDMEDARRRHESDMEKKRLMNEMRVYELNQLRDRINRER